MNIINITISNAHEKGFAFAITDEGDQVFVPPHVADSHNLSAGVSLTAQIAINPNEAYRNFTRFVAIRLRPDEVEDEWEPFEDQLDPQPAGNAALDEGTLKAIGRRYFIRTSQIAEELGVDTTTASNSANRLFNAGKISRADVYNTTRQSRPSFILWAKQASDFIEGSQ